MVTFSHHCANIESIFVIVIFQDRILLRESAGNSSDVKSIRGTTV